MKYEQFEKFLQDDLSWRKKEISDLYMICLNNNNKEVLFKSMILILYAHWEGYIKKSSKLYIKYIAEKKTKIGDLTPNFKAIVLKSNVNKCIENCENLTLSNELDFMNKYQIMANKKFKLNIDPDNDRESDIINTHNNLKPKVFKNIINILGLKYNDAYKVRENYISNNLLAGRNAIGHGSKFNLEEQLDFNLTINDLEKLKSIIVCILDFHKEILLDYVENEFYLSINSEKKYYYDEEKDLLLHTMLDEIEKKDDKIDIC